MRERDIEAYLVDCVRDRGGECRKVKWIGRRGAPDRVVMLWGSTIWVELKSPGKAPDPHQIREHSRMRAMGQTVVVIDSVDRIEPMLDRLA